MIYIKMHEKGGSQVLAIADPDLIGCELSNGHCSFRVSANFYAGNLIPQKDALDLLKNIPNVNLLGSVVTRAVEEGLISEEAVIWFQDNRTGRKIPHSMIIHL